MQNMSATTSSLAAVPYATPAAPRGAAWAGLAIVLGGLALIVLGGCFLIGAMLTINGDPFSGIAPPSPLTGAQNLFLAIMYVLAAVCVAGAAVMLVAGTRGLLRIMGG